MQVSPPRHGRPSVGALWLLTAIVAIPRAAQAGCGAEHPRPVVDLALLSRPDAFDQADLPTVPPGCPGGLCSKDRPAPITPPAPAPPRLEMWPILEAAWEPRAPASAFAIASGPLAYLGPIPTAPDRPPRRS